MTKAQAQVTCRTDTRRHALHTHMHARAHTYTRTTCEHARAQLHTHIRNVEHYTCKRRVRARTPWQALAAQRERATAMHLDELCRGVGGPRGRHADGHHDRAVHIIRKVPGLLVLLPVPHGQERAGGRPPCASRVGTHGRAGRRLRVPRRQGRGRQAVVLTHAWASSSSSDAHEFAAGMAIVRLPEPPSLRAPAPSRRWVSDPAACPGVPGCLNDVEAASGSCPFASSSCAPWAVAAVLCAYSQRQTAAPELCCCTLAYVPITQAHERVHAVQLGRQLGTALERRWVAMGGLP